MRRRVRYPRRLNWLVGLCVAMLFVGFVAFPPKLSDIYMVSPVVVDRHGQTLSSFTVEDGTWRMAVSLNAVDPKFLEALIAIEDKRFYTHSGVDPVAILRAGGTWFKSGQPLSGASTLTMQLVRLIEPRPRNLKSKIIESVRALQLELYLSKTEILEAYLTHAPYGGNLEGLESASQAYFGKSSKRLNDAEIALLIALPQAPEARRPDMRPEGARGGRTTIIRKLEHLGILSTDHANEAISSPIPTRRERVPELAWITAYGLAEPIQTTKTTLDRSLQINLETVTNRFVQTLDRPVNTAVTIVENKTRAVRAHIASADRGRPGGWIDMTDKARSPASTLKPFVYAMGMDDGVITSATVLQDRPTRFGAYQPENFNRRYHGNVRVFEALRHSLNVPAVAVLEKVGGQRFEDGLINAGVTLTRPGQKEEQAGLALALGGAGMSVNHVAMLYAALANEGQVAPLRWRESDLSDLQPLISKTSAKDITEILKQSPTPAGRVPGWLSKNAPPIAYKTGTSYGFRDAWAAGYTDDYTVVVWVGRPDGAPRPGQTGRLAAAPLLYDIFSLLPKTTHTQTFSKDESTVEGLRSFTQRYNTAPQIIFPPDEAQLYAPHFGEDARGFTLSAQYENAPLQFFVDGRHLVPEYERTIWRPEGPGFYSIVAIDASGARSESRVQVVSHSP